MSNTPNDTLAQDAPAGTVDAVIGLGSFCQVGGILWVYDVKDTNSPFDNFGLRDWTAVIPILRNRFADYWQRENLVIGEPFEDPFAAGGKTQRNLITYCSRYNIENRHHFALAENAAGELTGFAAFRDKLGKLERAFLRRCERYERIRFICKAMDDPAFEDTEVRQADVRALLDALAEVRGGKPFTLALAVPDRRYDELRDWVRDERIPHLHIARWTTRWNDRRGPEWDDALRDVRVPESRYERVWNEIYADDRPDTSLLEFNSTF